MSTTSTPTPSGAVGGLRRRLSRVPLRRRLVAGFVATMLVVLVGASAFVYWRVQVALDSNLDEGLERAATALATRVTPAGRLPADDADLASIDGYQVLAADGRVLSHGGRLRADPALGAGDLARAERAPLLRDTGELFVFTPPALRLYAVPVRDGSSGGGSSGASPAVLVVALDREQHDEALRELLAQLSAATLATLVLTALVGDLLARAALRPVETYRRQASDVAAGADTVRLDVPPDRDDEITRLGHTLNQMLDAQARSLERERRFTDDASHELRTPLTRLTSRVQLMLRRTRTVEEHERALEEVREDLTRLTALADDLLALGSAAREAGAAGAVGSGGAGAGVGAGLEPVDLAAVVRKVASLRTTLAPPGSAYGAAGALAVETDGVCAVGVEELRLERVVDNLLDNAVLHGAPPVRIGVGRAVGRDGSAWVRLAVTDDGPGAPADVLATATERFSRSPEARSRRGAGLGLSLVATLVGAAGGEVRLCHDGTHHGSHHASGGPAPVACDHGPDMTVTMLLPAAVASSA